MNSKRRLTIALAVMALMGGRSLSEACDAVFVQSKDMTMGGATIGMTLNSTPSESLGFTLTAMGSRIDTLAVGPGSANPLTLAAEVTQGTLSASCQVSVINENNTTQCSGVIDPKFILTVASNTTETCTTPPTPPSTDPACAKHDNGNHWGEYRKLGMTVPPHSGKPNACKEHGKKSGPRVTTIPTASEPVCTTVTKLSCSFVPVTSF